MRSTGAALAGLAIERHTRTYVYAISRDDGPLTVGDGGFAGECVVQLGATRPAHVEVLAGGERLVVAPVLRPHGPTMVLVARLDEPRADASTLIWLATGYAYVLALCGQDPGGLGRLLSSAREDPLTGCDTPTALRDRIDEEIGRAARHDRPLVCMYIDLDNFKSINDRWGHLVGDAVLSAAGHAMRGCIRSADTIGRAGSDEFVVLLPESTIERALLLAGRMRAAVRTSTRRITDGELTASVGLAAWQPGERREDLVGHADEALLRAKHEVCGMHAALYGVESVRRRRTPDREYAAV